MRGRGVTKGTISSQKWHSKRFWKRFARPRSLLKPNRRAKRIRQPDAPRDPLRIDIRRRVVIIARSVRSHYAKWPLLMRGAGVAGAPFSGRAVVFRKGDAHTRRTRTTQISSAPDRLAKPKLVPPRSSTRAFQQSYSQQLGSQRTKVAHRARMHHTTHTNQAHTHNNDNTQEKRKRGENPTTSHRDWLLGTPPLSHFVCP